jgi:hypothetical protein
MVLDIPSISDARLDFSQKTASYTAAVVRQIATTEPTDERSCLDSALYAGVLLILSRVKELGPDTPAEQANARTEAWLVEVLTYIQVTSNIHDICIGFRAIIYNSAGQSCFDLIRAISRIGSKYGNLMKEFQTFMGNALLVCDPETLHPQVRFLCAIMTSIVAANLLLETSAT